MEHSNERIKMPALTRRTQCIFRFLFGIFGSLLAVCVGFSAPLQQQDAIPVSTITELQSRADSGDSAARHQLTEFLFSADPSSPGYDQALSWLQSGASQNAPDAQFLLGYLYEHGKSLSRDFTKAAENYRRAALQGYAAAENNLGALYRRGYGVPLDMALAFHWYSLAAQHGSPAAQQNLGTFYYLGYTTPVDYVQAAKWYRASAEQGFSQAQNSLAFCYLRGTGVPRDDVQAAHWALLAAEQGHPRAEALLAYLYESGKGVSLDYVAAYAWYSRAVAAGDVSNGDRLKSLSQVMTGKQLEEANSLISAQSLALRPGPASSMPAARSLFPDH
jgi:TPR repeat protein